MTQLHQVGCNLASLLGTQLITLLWLVAAAAEVIKTQLDQAVAELAAYSQAR